MSSQSPLPAREPRVLGQPDYILLGATSALLVIGTLMVYSASFVVAHNEFGDSLYFLVRHLAAVGVGLAIMLVGLRLDYRRLRAISLIAMVVCVALLILVLIPGLGTRSYGSTRWLKLGPLFQVQPSELAKIALVVYLADWLARRGKVVKQFGNGMLPFVIIVVVIAGLVELQPDLGTTSVIVGAAASIFFVAGANLLHVGMLGAMGVLGGIALISRMSGYRQDRIAAFLDPWSDIQGSGWHTAQTLIALGSGGITGVGLGASHQKFYWVPNAHTDAIFAIIGEELGFLGTVTVLLLFVAIGWRGFRIAWHAPDRFGRFLATGLTALVVVQALVNIAVVTNTIPFTGVTLPLVSYGGNSIVASLAAIGLLLGISRHEGTAKLEDEGSDSAVAALERTGSPRAHPAHTRAEGQHARRARLTHPASHLIEGAAPRGAQARPVRRRASSRRTTRPPLRRRWQDDA